MITRRKWILPLMGALFLLVACQKPDNPTPAPSPTPTPTPSPTPAPVIEVPPASQPIFTSGISFNSGTNNPADNPGTGTGDNPGTGTGTGTGTDPGTGTEPAPEQPQSQVVNFTAPAAWSASIETTKAVDWLTVEPSSGAAGAVEMKVTAQPNNTYEERAATVTITCGGTTVSFTVTQAGKPRPVDVTEVKVDMTEVSLTEGESVTLIAMVSPDNATDKTVTWSSSNPAVATVNEGGKVTAVAAGEAVITAKAGEKTAACKVIVNAMPAPQPQPQPQPQPEPPVPVGVSSIVLDQTNLILQLGSGVTLVATVGPENAVDKTVTWESSNPAVATVDENGRVKTVGIGEAVITAKAGEKSATCKVTVNAVPVASIVLDKASMEMTEGDVATLVVTVGPENATDKSVSWSSSNTAVATVDAGGKVTAVTAGNATITVKAGDLSATCVVTVKKKGVQPGQNEGIGYGEEIQPNPPQPAIIQVASISLNKTNLSLTEGESETLSATVSPNNTTDQTVTWSSSNPAVATVDQSGKVTAIAVGSATITAQSGDKTATCSVTVAAKVIPVTSITLNKATLTLAKGNSETLIATVGPSNATNKTVTWSSSNPDIASVDQNGNVTATKSGSATITARAGEKTATCSVKVPVPAGGNEGIGYGEEIK